MRRTIVIAAVGMLALMGVAGRTLIQSSPAPAAAPPAPESVAGPEATEARLASAARPAQPPAGTPVRVALYGDSLASEAQSSFTDLLASAGGFEVRTHTFGGTAICDWFEQMTAEAAEWQPHAVVVEFSGNALTRCMAEIAGAADPTAARTAKYVADAERVLQIFGRAGSFVYFAGAPISRTAAEQGAPAGMNEVYTRITADRSATRYVAAGDAVLDRGHYTDTLPCLLAEPCTGGVSLDGRGFNVVRAPDGAHFCPGAPDAVLGVTTTCPVWSSGAYRFGLAMADPLLADFGTGTPAV
jgi:hypothetical protein